jgi:beta-lactamase class C
MITRSIAAVLLSLSLGSAAIAGGPDDLVGELVDRHVRGLVPRGGAGGVAVALRVAGRTHFFTYGYADLAAKQPVTADSLFNLGSVSKAFDATLLAHAVAQGELALDDPVAKHVTELQQGGDIRRVTLGQLASFSSGLVLAQDQPPWTAKPFTRSEFLAHLHQWMLPAGMAPGRQVIHVHSGFILLRLALERRFGMPFGELMEQRVFKPLGLASTTLPIRAADPLRYPRGELPAALRGRAVQGYDADGNPAGEPGDLQGYYRWLGTGQIYSSARDMGIFLAVNLGEVAGHRELQEAMKFAQQGVVRFAERSVGALAWERHEGLDEIVDRFGGLNNATAIAAMIPARKLGIVILCNHSGEDIVSAAHAVLLGLAAI